MKKTQTRFKKNMHARIPSSDKLLLKSWGRIIHHCVEVNCLGQLAFPLLLHKTLKRENVLGCLFKKNVYERQLLNSVGFLWMSTVNSSTAERYVVGISPCKKPLLCVFDGACPANDLFILFNSIFTAVTSSHDKMTIIIIMIILIIMVLIINISISKTLSP